MVAYRRGDYQYQPGPNAAGRSIVITPRGLDWLALAELLEHVSPGTRPLITRAAECRFGDLALETAPKEDAA